jgi:predicted ribosome quality control (RQC) complex YloA/Tae2 family protein
LRKKEFTSFDVAAVVRELKESIVNSRVSNIYQLNEDTVLLKLRGADGTVFTLVLEAGKRLHLTSYTLKKPLVPPAFCMALRKHLRGSWLTGIEQYEFERVVVFHFKGKIVFRLFLELFGEGNIILVDGENRIVQALHYKRMRDRNVLRGEAFLFAPPIGQNPMKISKQAFLDGLRSFGDVEVVRALARFLGIGGVYSEEVLLRLKIEKTARCNSLKTFQVEAIYNCLQELISQVSGGKLEPTIVFDESDEFFDVTPLRLKRYEGMKHQTYLRFNEALDEFYARTAVLEEVEAAGEKVDELRWEMERLVRVIAEQEKALKEAEQDAKKYRQIGDAIYVYSKELQTLLNKFLADRKAGKEWNEIVSEISVGKHQGLKPHLFFESFDEQRRTVNVCVNGLRFGLDLQKDLFANAAKFYEGAKNAKRKFEGAKAALEETLKRLEEAEVKLRKAEALEHAKPAKALEEFAKRRVKGKKWFEKFRWFISSDGFLVVAGKDATSNEVLIKKYTKPGDIVFHADIVGAPFVVVKTEDKQPGEQCLWEAAEFAAAFSRGWREGFASTDVYWVIPEQLSKAGGSGEYVPHGAFVVSGKRNWMRGIPLRTAIGAIFEGENGEITFVGGAVDAVKAKTKAYVTIVPGDISGKELLKQILKKLAEKMSKEQREKVLGASVEKIREFVPYGKGKVLLE